MLQPKKVGMIFVVWHDDSDDETAQRPQPRRVRGVGQVHDLAL